MFSSGGGAGGGLLVNSAQRRDLRGRGLWALGRDLLAATRVGDGEHARYEEADPEQEQQLGFAEGTGCGH